MGKISKFLSLPICLVILFCGCGVNENSVETETPEFSEKTVTSAYPEFPAETVMSAYPELPEETVTSVCPEYESSTRKHMVDFEYLKQAFSVPYSEYDARKEDFAEIDVVDPGFFPVSVKCRNFVIPEYGVECSAGMSYDDITGQLAQFSGTKLINYTAYNTGPHEYMFYENGDRLKTVVEYFLEDKINEYRFGFINIYRFCFVFDNETLSYIKVYYPVFQGVDSMLNRRYYMEYSDICFKHIDDLTAADMSMLLNTKRSYIYSLYNFSSLELRSRIMNTFYYSALYASPVIDTEIAYKTLIEGENWKDILEEYPLFILIDKGRFLGADIASDFSAVQKQWGEPLYEGAYEDKWRDEITYNYMTYVFEDIMVVCIGYELNKNEDIIISKCLVLPRENTLFTLDGAYICDQ